MKIWLLKSNPEGMRVYTKNDTDRKLLPYLEGESLQNNWKPIEVEVAKKGKGKDFPEYGLGRPIFSGKAKKIIEPLIQEHVEFLPMSNPDYEMYMCNILNVMDCVDKSKSVPYKSLDLVIGYNEIFFKEEFLQDTRRHIFKIPESLSTRCYVSDEFRELVLKSKLKGFLFIEAWDSEFTEDMQKEKERKYQAYIDQVNLNKGLEMNWSEAEKLIQDGKAVAHETIQIQLDKNGGWIVRQFTEELEYSYHEPVYIPPNWLELKWHEVDRENI